MTTDRTFKIAHSLRYASAFLALAAMPTAARGQGSAASDNSGGDDYIRRWGLQATVGSLTQQEDDGDVDSWSNDGNVFDISADWYVTRHVALTGGIYAEQTGFLTDYDSYGIGKRKFWMAGLHAGARYYPLPHKWVVQPYIGVSLYTNVLNLGHSRSSYEFMSNDYHSARVHTEYDVRCPALSLAPQVGVDLRLLSSLSLTFAADYRWGLYGHSRTDLRYIDGPDMGKTMHLENPMSRTTLSLGLKIDLPVRPVNWNRVGTSVLDLLYIWINGKN